MAKHKHNPSFLVEYWYKFIVGKVMYATTVSSNSYQPNAPHKNIIYLSAFQRKDRRFIML
jgi:hypothetical protein